MLFAVSTSVSMFFFGFEHEKQTVENKLESTVIHKEYQIELWKTDLLKTLPVFLFNISNPEFYDVLNGLKNKAEYQELFNTIKKDILKINNQLSFFEEIFIMNSNGKVILSTIEKNEDRFYDSEIYFLEGLKNSYIHRPIYSPSDNKISIIASNPITGINGEICGVIAGRTNISVLNQIVSEITGLGKTGESYIVGANNAFLCGANSWNDKKDNIFYIRTEGVNDAIKYQKNISGQFSNYLGNPVIGVYRWIPDLEIVAVAEQSEEESLYPIYENLRNNLTITFIILTIIIIIIFLITKSIVSPIESLSKIAEKVSKGNYNVRAPIKQNDEIGKLTKNFNLMMDNIKQAQLDIKKSEEKFRSLVETSSDWVWEIDKNGIYTYVSPKVKELLGYEPSEIIGKSPFDFMPSYEADKLENDFKKIVSSKQPFNGLINKNIHKNGNIVILDTNGSPFFNEHGDLLGFRGIDRDITKRIIAEQELRKAHAKLEEYSRTLEKKVTDRTMELQIKSDSLEQMNEDLNVTNKELLETNKMLLSTQEALEYSKMKIEKQNEKLKKLDELKSTFLNITSHELRTPMTSIKGYIQMFLKNMFGKINEKQKSTLTIVLRNINRLDNLIQDILDISRLESGTMKFIPVNINISSITSEVIETMYSFAEEKKIKIKQDIIGKIPDLFIDKDRIKQVMINLVNNAIKFSPLKSVITITVHADEEFIYIEIKDCGRGIPKEKQDLVFKTFYQVDGGMDRKFGGAGLGLAISQGIVLAHGGEIWVESDGIEGNGSTFTFTLPLKSVNNIEDRFKEVELFKI